MKGVTINLAAVGYDCAPTVRDRLMGLWQDVCFEWGGPVRIVDPFVRTQLSLPALDYAALTVTVDVTTDSATPVSGRFRATIGDLVAEKDVTLAAGTSITLELSAADFPQSAVRNPQLWWPLGHGPQHLYDLLGEARLDAEFRYLAAAGVNTVSYEDLPNPPDLFLDLCDRYGIMLWHCFFQCHWLTTDDHPLDHGLLWRHRPPTLYGAAATIPRWWSACA